MSDALYRPLRHSTFMLVDDDKNAAASIRWHPAQNSCEMLQYYASPGNGYIVVHRLLKDDEARKYIH